jgi:hypothetical protein
MKCCHQMACFVVKIENLRDSGEVSRGDWGAGKGGEGRGDCFYEEIDIYLYDSTDAVT